MRKIFPLALSGFIALLGACSDDSSTGVDDLEALSSSSLDSDSPNSVGSEGNSSGNESSDGKSSSSGKNDSNESSSSVVDAYVEDPVGKEVHYVGNSTLRITEIATNNVNFIDEYGEDPGWIEIYNAGTETANLRGYSIVENLEKPRKWIIDSLTIPAGELRVVFCSGRDVTAPHRGLDSEKAHYRTHTNWKLEKSGGTIYLIDYNWGIRDSVSYPELDPGISWGIVNGGEWRYFEKPTPEKKNSASTGYDGFTKPVALKASGFFAEPFSLDPPTPTSGGTIRCSFDGSTPNKNSEEFRDSKYIEANMIVRCGEFVDNKITNKISTSTYFVGESVSMPVVSISVDPEFFNKHYLKVSCSKPEYCPSGLYADVEFPVHVEYFEKGSSSQAKAWEIEAGISLMGNYSRMENKKSVAIVMREDYQDGRLNYPLFETRKDKNSKFKGFNLRNNGNRFVSDYIEDAMGGALLEGSGVDYQRSRQVVVFYNGNYYGIHDMREHYNRHYVETNYGIDADEVTMVKHLGKEITASGGGSTKDYMDMMDFVYSHDFSGSDNPYYAQVQGMLDVGNFADYMIAEMYIHNGDWPNNNVRAWRTAKQPWKFMVYDLDHGFDWEWNVSGFGQSTNMFKWVKQGGSSSCNGENCFATIFNKLIKNSDFKRLFVNHAAVMFQNNLNAANVEKTVDAMAGTLVSSETERDLAKFKQTDRWYQNSCGNGFSVSGSCMKTWAEKRDGVVWSEYTSEFGLGSEISVTISASGSGTVLLDGMALPSKSYKGKFFGGNAMLLTALPSGSAVFKQWKDGSRENPRLVTPKGGESYEAEFQ